MELKLLRFDSGTNDTLGILFMDGKFTGFTLEDEYREVKVMNETRVPAGTYEIKYTYSPKYKKFMLELMNVPNFSGIRIHPGNTEQDTSGCILVGNVCRHNPFGDSRIEDSRIAYDRIASLIINALGRKENVNIIIKDNV
jgi:hypothetical protein